jgi:hypothetical protein
VARWFGRKPAVFRGVGVGLGRGWVATVRLGAGQSERRVGGDVPCRWVWRARPGEDGVHGNTRPAPYALDALRTTVQHGCSDAHGRARVLLSWGIDQARVEELGGEVTGPGAVGAVQPKMGVHDGQGDGAGGVGCLTGVSAQWGRGFGSLRGGGRLQGVNGCSRSKSRGRRGETLAGPWASLSPRVQTVDDKRKGLQKSLDSKRKSPAGLSSLLVGL